jgi:DNA-binding transcriptional LysR family regulator
LNRMGKDVTPTEAGERLLSYARRLLALAEEARDVLARPRTACSLAPFLRGRDERSSR